jgi:hypothetical protein
MLPQSALADVVNAVSDAVVGMRPHRVSAQKHRGHRAITERPDPTGERLPRSGAQNRVRGGRAGCPLRAPRWPVRRSSSSGAGRCWSSVKGPSSLWWPRLLRPNVGPDELLGGVFRAGDDDRRRLQREHEIDCLLRHQRPAAPGSGGSFSRSRTRPRARRTPCSARRRTFAPAARLPCPAMLPTSMEETAKPSMLAS